MLRVFIVDDSAFTRKALTRVLGAHDEFLVVGEAATGPEALDKIPAARPDVVTLDVDLPGMNGLAILRELVRRYPKLPVLMLSALTQAGAEITLEALSLGAVDFIDKTSFSLTDLDQLSHRLLDKLRIWTKVRTRSDTPSARPARSLGRNVRPMFLAARTGRFKLPPPAVRIDWSRYDLCVIGASTGGPPALESILSTARADFPLPIAIVQHMPAGFTRPFAERLNGLSHLTVSEARQADRLAPGMAVIAPAGQQLRVTSQLDLKLGEGGAGERHAPSVDVLLRSAVRSCHGRVLAILLTGMGDDGAAGMVELKQAGGLCMAESEESCVVFGMPRAAQERGGVHHMLALRDIAYLFVATSDTDDQPRPAKGD